MRAFITLIDASGHVLVENKEIEPSYTETVYNPKDMLYEVYNKFQFSYSESMTAEKYRYLKAFNKGVK